MCDYNGLIQKYIKEDNNEYLESSTEYLSGKKNGLERIYYPNNNLKKITNYSIDDPHGNSKEYYPNGNIKSDINYWYGMRNGKYSYWWENGNLKIETNYFKNLIHENYKEYDANGNIIEKDYYIKGVKQQKKQKETIKTNINNKYTTYEKFYYENGRIIQKDIFYPFSKKVKTCIKYFPNDNKIIREKKNFNLVGKLDGIYLLRDYYKGRIFIRKKIKYLNGNIIPYDDLVYKNKNKLCIISLPNVEIYGWKACLSNDPSTYGDRVMVKLKIPKRAKRLLFIEGGAEINKSRAEYAHVEEIHSFNDPNDGEYNEAYSFLNKKKRIIYKKGEIVYPDFFDDNMNNVSSGGIYYCLLYEDAIKYHDKN